MTDTPRPIADARVRHPARTSLMVALAVVAALGYAGLWLAYARHGGWLDTLDNRALDPLYRYGVTHPRWVRAWDVFCTVFGPGGFRVVGVIVVVVAVRRHNVRAAVFVLATIGLSPVLTQVAKNLADRPRPPGALAAATSSAFPSGHAVEVLAAVLALMAISGVTGRRAKVVVAVCGAATVLAIGVGRVVLVVHHPSDVVAGWALGYLWFVCWLLVIRPRALNARAAPAETPRAPGSEP